MRSSGSPACTTRAALSSLSLNTGARCATSSVPMRVGSPSTIRNATVHPAPRRCEHRVDLRVAKAASPVVDAQLGDVLAERRRRGAPAVDEELTPRQLAERRDEHEPAARRPREHDQLQLVRRHFVSRPRTASDATSIESCRPDDRTRSARRSRLRDARRSASHTATPPAGDGGGGDRDRTDGKFGYLATGPVRKVGRVPKRPESGLRLTSYSTVAGSGY